MSTKPTFMVLTLIGDDRPGLVGQLSAVISAHQSNWLDSSMSQLAGKFAGILKVSVPPDQIEALKRALEGLTHLKVVAELSAIDESPQRGRRLKMSLVGQDRIGIVREVSQVLTRHAVNVEALNTHTSSAPMSGDSLFHAHAELHAGPDFDARSLIADFERLSDDLMVDITLDETIITSDSA